MEFFNGPVERWVKSQKHPFLRGLPWRFPKFQIHWSLAVPNSTPTPPPWTRNHLLGELQSNWVQPHLRTTSAGHWPNNLPSWHLAHGETLETQVQRPRKTWENHTHLYPRMIHEKKSTNRSGWTIHWQTVQLQLERVAPKFWTTFSIVLSVAEVAERRNPFASILSRTLLLQIFRSVFPPQPTPKKWINKKNHSNQNLKLPLPPATKRFLP